MCCTVLLMRIFGFQCGKHMLRFLLQICHLKLNMFLQPEIIGGDYRFVHLSENLRNEADARVTKPLGMKVMPCYEIPSMRIGYTERALFFKFGIRNLAPQNSNRKR